MKGLLFLIFALLVGAVGCLPFLSAPAPANEPPVAYVDSVSASQINPGDKLTFTGHGVDPNPSGSIVAYSWRSSIDGELSTSPSFSTTSLSQGIHTIWFKVQNNKGNWSKEVSYNVNVFPSWAIPPVINSFEASPLEIATGESSTLTWNVANASMVEIDPDIGNVAINGSRVVFPTENTVYTLTATNKGGSVTATTEVAITAVPVHTVELVCIAAEDGQVRRDGYVGQEPNVGSTTNGVAMEAFLAFDISMIPQGARIKSASLDLTTGGVYGNPFASFGRLYIYSCNYSTLSSNDFFIGIAPGPVYTTPSMPTAPISSTLLNDAVQAQVDAGNPRFQLRLQFEKCCFYLSQADYVAFGEGTPRLTISY